LKRIEEEKIKEEVAEEKIKGEEEDLENNCKERIGFSN